MTGVFDIRPEVAAAREDGRAVVALESTVIAQGLPSPHNLEAAHAVEAAVRDQGAVPATIGLVDGRVVIGLSADEIARFARGHGVTKVSLRDLAWVLADRGLGATTVAAAVHLAARAGIRVFATGGIGGVHRGGADSLDISADLDAIAASPVAVVSAGVKAILDLPRTMEVLETKGVPVIGLATDRFPGFYCRDSGIGLGQSVDGPAAAARLLQAQWAMGLPGGVLFANPPPAAHALERAELEGLISRALAAADNEGISGKEVTPFLLADIARATGGRSVAVNVALLEDNAREAGRIAVAYARMGPTTA